MAGYVSPASQQAARELSTPYLVGKWSGLFPMSTSPNQQGIHHAITYRDDLGHTHHGQWQSQGRSNSSVHYGQGQLPQGMRCCQGLLRQVRQAVHALVKSGRGYARFHLVDVLQGCQTPTKVSTMATQSGRRHAKGRAIVRRLMRPHGS